MAGRPERVVAKISSPPAGEDTPLVRARAMPGEPERVAAALGCGEGLSIVPAANPRAPEPDEDVFVMKSIPWPSDGRRRLENRQTTVNVPVSRNGWDSALVCDGASRAECEKPSPGPKNSGISRLTKAVPDGGRWSFQLQRGDRGCR